MYENLRPEPARVMKLGYLGWAIILFAIAAPIAVLTFPETGNSVLVWGIGAPLFVAFCAVMGIQIVRGLYEFARDFVAWIRR